MKQFLIIALIFLSPILCWGQKDKPFWVTCYSSDLPNSVINVESASGYSAKDARDKAMQLITESQSLATGQRNNINIDNGIVTVKGNDDLTVKARIRDEFTDQIAPGEYRVYLLVQTAKNPEFQLEPVTITDRYGFSPRVFVPGMAQIHKGQNVKGALFIGGEVAAVAGIIAFEGMRASYESKINRTHNASEKQNYITNAENMRNIRNGFICGAAAIYVWNVIDGIVSKGKKHLEVGKPQIALAPYSDIQSAGVLLAVTF